MSSNNFVQYQQQTMKREQVNECYTTKPASPSLFPQGKENASDAPIPSLTAGSSFFMKPLYHKPGIVAHQCIAAKLIGRDVHHTAKGLAKIVSARIATLHGYLLNCKSWIAQ